MMIGERVRRLVCLGVVFLSVLAMPCWAGDFSAERIVKSGKSTITAHINAKDDRWRFEYAVPQQGASVVIVRADRKSAWHILSKRRQYAEVPIGKEHRLSMSETMEGEQSRQFIGDEMLNGYPTELFEVTVADNGEARHYYQWVSKKERFPIKTVSKQGSWSEEYRHLIFTEQSPFLFELPQRLDPVTPSATKPPSMRREGEDTANVAEMGDRVDSGASLNPATKARAAAKEAMKHLSSMRDSAA